MYPIPEQKWGEVNIHTWGELSPHLWECFRLALMVAETEQEVQGLVVEFSKAIYETITEMQCQGVRVEHSPAIMKVIAEMIVSIVVSTRDYKAAILEYLPWYERESVIFNAVLDAFAKEFRRLEQDLSIVERNIFLDTAIELLHIHERDLSIVNGTSKLNYTQRREQISSRYRASFDQTTEETIKAVASAYSNGEVEVNKTDTSGLYEIKFVGTKGTPDNLDGLKQALDIIIPAHLGLTYTFTYNAWEFLRDITWGEVSNITWNELRTWDEVV